MANKISKTEVAKTGQLARLALSSAEIDKFSLQLASVLENFSQMNKLKTEKVKITAQVTGLEDVLVADSDEMKIAVSQKELLANVPESDQGFIVVPKVFE